MRAVASAILMFFINLIGLGLGPQIVGIMNDVLASSFGTHSIRYSLTIVGVTNILAGIHFLIASKHLKKDMEAKNR